MSQSWPGKEKWPSDSDQRQCSEKFLTARLSALESTEKELTRVPGHWEGNMQSLYSRDPEDRKGYYGGERSPHLEVIRGSIWLNYDTVTYERNCTSGRRTCTLLGRAKGVEVSFWNKGWEGRRERERDWSCATIRMIRMRAGETSWILSVTLGAWASSFHTESWFPHLYSGSKTHFL